MVTYTVHEREDETGDISQRAGKIVFVREGVAWLALVIPFLWLLYHRMWFVLIAFITLIAGLQSVVIMFELGDEFAGWTALFVNSAFALTANDLRRWTLGLRGCHLVDIISGKNREECELRYFTDWLGMQQGREDEAPGASLKLQQQKAAPSSLPKSSDDADGVIGLFPEPAK